MYRASFIISYCDQQMHNYFTNYHTTTCFDTIVSCSGNSSRGILPGVYLALSAILCLYFYSEWVERGENKEERKRERKEERKKYIFYFNTCTVHRLFVSYCGQQMHNYFTNYHTTTCFDTIMSCSGNL